MKKFLIKSAIIGSLVVGGATTMTGCTTLETGVAVGAVASVLALGAVMSDGYYYRGCNYGADRNRMYQRGVHNGCSSAEGKIYKSRYRWKRYTSYRDGWRAGYKNCQ